MPNWCNNVLTLRDVRPQMIQRAVEAYNKGALFNEFHPIPEELRETTSPSMEPNAELIRKYGFDNWYDWCVANWGTKWDMGGDGFDETVPPDSNEVTLCFDTAWSPPIAFYQHLEDEYGFEVKAYYYEPGMAYCGLYEDGVDEDYAIEGNSDWVRDNIPSDINEMFNIADNMAEWEEDEAEAEEEETNEDESK